MKIRRSSATAAPRRSEKLGRVTPEFFSTLGVRPLAGRSRSPTPDMTYQTDHVAILSHEYWQSHYNADPGVLGKRIRMDGDQKVIVGVLAGALPLPLVPCAGLHAALVGGGRAQRRLPPQCRQDPDRPPRGRRHCWRTPGAQVDASGCRARPRIPRGQAGRRGRDPHGGGPAPGGLRCVDPAHPHPPAGRGPVSSSSSDASTSSICCCIRASNRSREMAIRQALGAGRRQIIRDVMTETMTPHGRRRSSSAFGSGRWASGSSETLGVDRLPLGAEVVFNGRLAGSPRVLGAVGIGAAVAVPIAWFKPARRARARPQVRDARRHGEFRRAAASKGLHRGADRAGLRSPDGGGACSASACGGRWRSRPGFAPIT